MQRTLYILTNLKRFPSILILAAMILSLVVIPSEASEKEGNRIEPMSDGLAGPRLASQAPSRDPAATTATTLPTLAAVQQSRLVATDPGSFDEFGWSVAISGDTAVVGARNEDPMVGDRNLTDAGAAYVFVREGNAWLQQAKLTPKHPQEGESFGVSVAIDGNTIVVGAPGRDIDDHEDAGIAYAFVRRGTTWEQQAKLLAEDPAENDSLGASIDIDGNTVIVGADSKDHLGLLVESGAAYVFLRNQSQWKQQAKLIPSDFEIGDLFGIAVAIDGNTAVVGATETSIEISRSTGTAYVFRREGKTWVEKAKLMAEDGRNGDFFGRSVDIKGGTIAVGALFKDPDLGQGRLTNAGAVYIFTGSGSTWRQKGMLVPDDARVFDHFGRSVAITGNSVVVGADGGDWAGMDNTGSAYIFSRRGLQWFQQTKLVADNAGEENAFGRSVAIDGDTMVIGSIGADPGSTFNGGAAYAFKLVELELPETGFAPDQFTSLPNRQVIHSYNELGDLWLEIPALEVQTPIIGIPRVGRGWDVSWLGDRAGYLEGTAFPTWKGNTAISAHVYLSNGLAGPFRYLSHLRWGDQFTIHAWGQRYTYEVRSNFRARPDDLGAIRHETLDWVTLITCQGYDEASDSYQWRNLVRGVLVSYGPD